MFDDQTVIEGWKPCLWQNKAQECRRCKCWRWKTCLKIHNCECAGCIHETCLMEEINQHRFAGDSHVYPSPLHSMLIYSCPKCCSPTLFSMDHAQKTVPFSQTEPYIQQYLKYLYMVLFFLFGCMIVMWVALILCGHAIPSYHVKMCSLVMLGIFAALWVTGWLAFFLKSRWRLRVFFRPRQGSILEEVMTETEQSIKRRLTDTIDF